MKQKYAVDSNMGAIRTMTFFVEEVNIDKYIISDKLSVRYIPV